MKGEITEQGTLSIERAGKITGQACPYSSNIDCCCGDWCPMFREPEPPSERIGVSLDICNNSFYFDEFEDKR